MTIAKRQQVPLGQVGEFRAGFGFPLHLQGRTSGDYPFAKVGDISQVARSGEHQISAAGHYVDDADLSVLKAKPVPVGTIVFAKIGEAIRQNFRAITSCEMLIDNNTMGLVPNTSIVDRQYLFQYMNQLDLYPYTGATTVPALRKSTLETIPIPLPPLAEQKRIADILDKADAIRRKRQQAIEQLRELPASLFQQHFGRAGRDLGMTRSETFRWPLGTVGDAIDRIETGSSPQTTNRPPENGEPAVLKVSAVTWTEFKPEESKALPLGFDTSRMPTVKRGDLLLSRANTAELLASPVIVRDDYPNLHLSDKTLRLVPKRHTDPVYLLYALRHSTARRFFESNAAGTSGSMRNVSQATIRNCPIPLPPLAAQKRFGEMVSHVDVLIAKMRTKLDTSISMFHSLQQRAFAGEL